MIESAEPILNSTAFKLHRATVLIDRVADDYLSREHDIRFAPFLVLLMARVLGPTSQQAIAANLGVSRASITQRVSALAKNNLLEVKPDPADARAHLVSLTPEGRERVEKAWRGLEAHQDGIDDGVDEPALVTQLDLIIGNATRILGGSNETP